MNISIANITRSLLLALTLTGSIANAALTRDGNYKIDPDHTNIGFEVSHLGVSFVVGRFDKFQGDVKLNAGGATQVTVQVDVASVNTKVAQRDQHLRSADFFNTSQFPKASFESTDVEYDDQGNPKLIHGNLTLHGRTKPVTLTASPIGAGVGPLGETRVGFHATTKIKRSEFGMTSLLAVAGDEVTVTLNVEAIQQ